MPRAGAEETGKLKYLFKNIRDKGKTQMRALSVECARGRTDFVALICHCEKISDITVR